MIPVTAERIRLPKPPFALMSNTLSETQDRIAIIATQYPYVTRI